MLNYNEIKPRTYIVLDEVPYEVLSSHVFRKQQRKPVNATKLKNLITGKVTEHAFHQSDKVTEAEIVERPARYLYSHRGEVWFSDPGNPADRFKLPADRLGPAIQWVRPNSDIGLLAFQDNIIGAKIPIKMALRVTEAPPAARGNTVQGAMKKVRLETGQEIDVPLFIEADDTIIVNTDTATYVERASATRVS